MWWNATNGGGDRKFRLSTYSSNAIDNRVALLGRGNQNLVNYMNNCLVCFDVGFDHFGS